MTPVMKAVGLACGVAVAYLTWQVTTAAEPPAAARSKPTGGRPSAPAGAAPTAPQPWTQPVPGRTQPVPGRVGQIAPSVLEPVVRVLVAAGDRVTAGQRLVELDSAATAADVRARKAALAELEAGLARLQAMPREEERAEARATLEAARVAVRAARLCHERLEGLRQADAISVRQHEESHAALLRAEAEERAAAAHLDVLLKQPVGHEIAEMAARVAGARAALEAAEAALDDCTVTAPIDGVISRLDVSPGTVSAPGAPSWGEILDLREIDVRCDVAPDQADSLALGQTAEVSLPGSSARSWSGRIHVVGNAADPQTGKVPVVLRIAETREQLRSLVEVTVRLKPAAPGDVAGPRPAPPSPVASAR